MYEVNISAPNLVSTCVNRVTLGGPEGRLYNKYDAAGYVFHNVNELLLGMEKTFELSNYPQSSTRVRTFSNKDEKRKEKKRADQMVNAEEILEKSGELATFVIHVKYRQNSTWQGDIFWAEEQKKVYFRSALEMLKLIDNALDETADNAEGGDGEMEKRENTEADIQKEVKGGEEPCCEKDTI